jgi:uncharacterized protein
MKTEIKHHLSRLEKEHNIKILYAVESGSRAWGFPSIDSDWDVRFIFIYPLGDYLKIDEKRDTIEAILPNDIDFAGWDLKKALRLFRKSNPPLLEWLRSPIVYLQQFSIADKLRNLSDIFFEPKSCMHHYLHMAEGNYRGYLQSEMVRVKKYFYVLRPILACDWIRNTNTMAPMEFETLVETQIEESNVKKQIDQLLQRKVNGEELSTEPKISLLNDFLSQKIDYYNQYLKNFPKNPQPDTNLLDKLFSEAIQEAWENGGS